MELRIKHRLILPLLLPKEGTFAEFNLKKSIIGKIEISEKERADINLRQSEESGNIEWDTAKDVPLEPMLTQDEMAYLKKAIENLSEQKLSDDHWDTCQVVYDALPKEQ